LLQKLKVFIQHFNGQVFLQVSFHFGLLVIRITWLGLEIYRFIFSLLFTELFVFRMFFTFALAAMRGGHQLDHLLFGQLKAM
jgi:hypothetical protein